MNNRDEYLLEQYFSKRITLAELEELQQLTAANSELEAEFDFQKKTAAAFAKNERARLKSILQEQEKKRQVIASTPWSVWTKYGLAAAAAIALLIFAGPYIWQSFNGQTTQAVAAVKFVPYPNRFASAGAGDATTTLEKASTAYQAQEYRKAAELFSQITPIQPVYKFYQGVALVGAKEYTQALEVLKPISADQENEYAAVALYFIAESQWETGNKSAAAAAAKDYLATPKMRGDDGFRKNAALIAANQ